MVILIFLIVHEKKGENIMKKTTIITTIEAQNDYTCDIDFDYDIDPGCYCDCDFDPDIDIDSGCDYDIVAVIDAMENGR
jgi:hypothetical protein